jgi:AcrR family transcriptional regulator
MPAKTDKPRDKKGRRALGRPPGSSGTDRKQQILVAARHLFAEHEPEAVSTEFIANAAGVTRTAIYHYFPTRSDLVRAVLIERMDWQWWKPVVDRGRDCQSFSDRLDLLLSECISRALLTEADVYFPLVRASRRDPEVKAALRSYRDDMKSSIDTMVKESIEDGLLASGVDRDAIVDAVLGLIWCLAAGAMHTSNTKVQDQIKLAAKLATGQIVATSHRSKSPSSIKSTKGHKSTKARSSERNS